LYEGAKVLSLKLLAPPARTTLVFLGAATAAWAITVDRMRGMDAGPGAELGGLGWFLGVWAAMMAAMMLPSAVPAAVAVTRASRALPTALFGVGYLAVWTAFGVVAYALFRVVTSFDLDWLAWEQDGPYAAGGVIVLAGIYELAPVKEQLLRRCRSPHDPAERGALGAGVANGLYCVGCCLGLMAVLFALGVMSVFWMVVIAAVIFVEKVLPEGPRLRFAVGAGLIALGLWVAVSPSTVPMLTEPGRSPSMEMEMQ
jgi:predicted metal-binding membrane protein